VTPFGKSQFFTFTQCLKKVIVTCWYVSYGVPTKYEKEKTISAHTISTWYLFVYYQQVPSCTSTGTVQHVRRNIERFHRSIVDRRSASGMMMVKARWQQEMLLLTSFFASSLLLGWCLLYPCPCPKNEFSYFWDRDWENILCCTLPCLQNES